MYPIVYRNASWPEQMYPIRPSGPERADLWAVLRVAEGLRDHVKALLKANQRSWQGHPGDSME